MMRKHHLRVAAATFALTTLVIIALADMQQLPSFVKQLYVFPGGDKVGHVVLMGALSLLVNAAVAASSSVKATRRMVIATLVVTLVIAAEEFSQQLFPNRTMSWEDLACSLIGIWLVGFGGVTLARHLVVRRLA